MRLWTFKMVLFRQKLELYNVMDVRRLVLRVLGWSEYIIHAGECVSLDAREWMGLDWQFAPKENLIPETYKCYTI